MGLRTLGMYILTTVVAITIGLVLVNALQPGKGISHKTVAQLTETYASNTAVTSKLEEASRQKDSEPLQFLVDMVPNNALAAMSNNGLMLQVICFTVFLSISLLLIEEKKQSP